MSNEHKAELPPHLDINIPLMPSKAPQEEVVIKEIKEEEANA